MGEVLYSAMEFFNLPSEEKRSSCLATCISRRDMERDWGMALTRSSSGEFSWSIMHLHLKTGLVHGPRIHQSIGVPKSQYTMRILYLIVHLSLISLSLVGILKRRHTIFCQIPVSEGTMTFPLAYFSFYHHKRYQTKSAYLGWFGGSCDCP